MKAGSVVEDAALGFSAMAGEYDALARSHPVVIWLRRRIRKAVRAQLPPGGSILELNAGSGLDAAYFASQGYRVHATDIAPGMIEAIAEKARHSEVGGRLTYERADFRELGSVRGGPYDLVLSNLGGLNCTNDLASVFRQLPSVLVAGGAVVLVIMPPVCPWELAQAFRGHWRTALRRLGRNGTIANVGGASVRTWYHSTGKVRATLGPEFEVVALRSHCLFTPPSFVHRFGRDHPRLLRGLMRLDDRLGGLPLFNRGGDFFSLVARYQSVG